MTRATRLLASAGIIAATLSGPVLAQAPTPTALKAQSLMKVDTQSLAAGYRASTLIGSTVVNEADETVGTIDDLIIAPNEKVPFAVLSVGGFLGMGKEYVVVPFNELRMADHKTVLPGATKESLKSLPDFKYGD